MLKFVGMGNANGLLIRLRLIGTRMGMVPLRMVLMRMVPMRMVPMRMVPMRMIHPRSLAKYGTRELLL